MSGRFDLIDKCLGKVRSRDIGNPVLVSEQNITTEAEVPGMGSGIVGTEITRGRNSVQLPDARSGGSAFELLSGHHQRTRTHRHSVRQGIMRVIDPLSSHSGIARSNNAHRMRKFRKDVFQIIITFFSGQVMCPGYCGECLRPDWRFGMSGQRKYSMELRERATRMALEARADPGRRRGAIKRISGQLGINPEALRTWVRAVEQGGRNERGEISDQEARIRALEAENRELRRANEILKAASAFFGAELDRLGR